MLATTFSLGRPEPLKHKLKGYRSRQFTDGHRLVCSILNENIFIASCRNRYF